MGHVLDSSGSGKGQAAVYCEYGKTEECLD
jgi:hypothetical protein